MVTEAAGAGRVVFETDQKQEEDHGMRVEFVNVREKSMTAHWKRQKSAPETGLKHPHKAEGTTYKKMEVAALLFDGVIFMAMNSSKMVLHDIRLFAEPRSEKLLVGSTGAWQDHHHNLINCL